MVIGNSGRASLDYLGTLRYRRGPQFEEHLSQPADLAAWAAGSGLVTEPLRVTPAELAAAREVREVLYRVIVQRIDAGAPAEADVLALNAAARRPPVELSLDADGVVHRVGTVSQFLSTVVRDALDLLGSDQIGLVRECDGPTCTRLYVDASRARNRRWCSNAECGNRAKVAAFRHRAGSRSGPVDADR
jgi:predicted RNA-binding Zn ribbon-like protein